MAYVSANAAQKRNYEEPLENTKKIRGLDNENDKQTFLNGKFTFKKYLSNKQNMMVVYDEENKNECVLKKIKESLNEDDLSKLKEKMNMLQCQYIHKFNGYFEQNDKIYFISDYYRKGDLKSYLSGKNQYQESEEEAMSRKVTVAATNKSINKKWFLDLAKGLAFLHIQSITNICLKPSKIMIANNDTLKISCDLDTLLSNDNWIKPNDDISYMSPEILNWEVCSDKSDVWSLGIVFYEMSHFKLPFINSERKKLRNSILNDQPSIDYSKLYSNLIKKMLEKEKNQRPSVTFLLAYLDNENDLNFNLNNFEAFKNKDVQKEHKPSASFKEERRRYEEEGPRYEEEGPRYEEEGPRYEEEGPRYEEERPRYVDVLPEFERESA